MPAPIHTQEKGSGIHDFPSKSPLHTPHERAPTGPISYKGSCYCRDVEYVVELKDPAKDARTSICYCQNCRKWTGSAFGIATKVPKNSFKITKGETKKHTSDNGSGTKLHREFCGTCGGGILEYGEHAGDSTYVTYGSFEDPADLPPKGEFFCKYRESWMPEIPGSSATVVCSCWHNPQPRFNDPEYEALRSKWP